MKLISRLPLQTKNGKRVSDLALLSDEGGQGQIYKVDCGGQTKVLKVYRRLMAQNRDFRKNLINNLAREAPDPHFVWPQDLVDGIEAEDEEGRFGTYGYIMDLYPGNYLSVAQILKGKTAVKLEDDYIRCRAVLRICTAFRQLHIRGLSYQDINSKNVLIHPRSGDIRIGDTDNIAPEGTAFVEGTQRFMAPEIVRDSGKPQRTYMANFDTDDYSLAVLIFMLMFRAHPLEGQYFHKSVITEATSNALYGTRPCYIFDHIYHREDYSTGSERRKRFNGPYPPESGLHTSLYRMLLRSPVYLLNAFAKSFSRGSLEGTVEGIGNRTKDYEWVEIFLRLQAQYRICPSCRHGLFEREKMDKCPLCEHALPTARRVRLGGVEYTAPLLPGRMIAHSQFGPSKISSEAEPVVWIGTEKGGSVCIENVSGDTLTVCLGDKKVDMKPQAALKALPSGLRILSDEGEISLE